MLRERSFGKSNLMVNAFGKGQRNIIEILFTISDLLRHWCSNSLGHLSSRSILSLPALLLNQQSSH